MKIILMAIGAIALVIGGLMVLVSVVLVVAANAVPASMAGLAGGVGFSAGLSAIFVSIFFFSFASVLGFLQRIAHASETVERIAKAGSQHPKRQSVFEGVTYWVYEDDRVVADMNGTHQQFNHERELLALLREAARAAKPRAEETRAPRPRAEDTRAPRPRAARS
jgi:predicted lipid-binding transport protein (Tim44 family)